jgi:hypothetical protein
LSSNVLDMDSQGVSLYRCRDLRRSRIASRAVGRKACQPALKPSSDSWRSVRKLWRTTWRASGELFPASTLFPLLTSSTSSPTAITLCMSCSTCPSVSRYCFTFSDLRCTNITHMLRRKWMAPRSVSFQTRHIRTLYTEVLVIVIWALSRYPFQHYTCQTARTLLFYLSLCEVGVKFSNGMMSMLFLNIMFTTNFACLDHTLYYTMTYCLSH